MRNGKFSRFLWLCFHNAFWLVHKTCIIKVNLILLLEAYHLYILETEVVLEWNPEELHKKSFQNQIVYFQFQPKIFIHEYRTLCSEFEHFVRTLCSEDSVALSFCKKFIIYCIKCFLQINKNHSLNDG